MIHEIWSDRPTFKRLRFHSGLNIVVATKTSSKMSDSMGRRSRNGAGKSSVIDVVRFVLGGEVRRDQTVIAAAPLAADTFFMTFDILGKAVTASRTPARGKSGRIQIQGAHEHWPIQPDIDEKTGEISMARSTWLDLLGQVFFGFPDSRRIPSGSRLSFLSCIAYFSRRGRDGAFADWRRTFDRQGAADYIVPLSFLFGLDTDVALKFVQLAEAQRRDNDVRKALHQEVLSALGSKGQVRNAIVKADRSADRLRARLESTSVVDFYGEFEREAANLDARVRELNDGNYIDSQYLHDLEEAIGSERAPELPDLARLYAEAGIVLPGVTLQRYADVQRFHEVVVSNRAEHLSAEIAATRERIAERTRERDAIVDRHDEILEILKSGLSRGHYARLERELAEVLAEAAQLKKNYELIERFENSQVDVKTMRIDAERALRADLSEREELIRQAVAIFQEASSALYSEPAEFDIAADATGPRFDISKPDIGSIGVRNMQVFCFDITMALMLARRGSWPGFLMHDSHIFDGVDGRQIGAALRVAERMLSAIDGQYIVTINSDDLEKAAREYGDDFAKSIVPPELSDAEEGGLFGFRFEHWKDQDGSS